MRGGILILCLVLAASGAGAGEPLAVTDGDTLQLGPERIRITGLDTAELRAQCDAERRLALLSARRLEVLIASGEVAIERRGRDRYGRTLARVTVDGVNIAETMIREGYARAWTGKRESWCD